MIGCSTTLSLFEYGSSFLLSTDVCFPAPQLIDLFSKLGVDGLLVEYEDMFPYEGELKLLQATTQHAYRCSLGHKPWTLLSL